MTADRRSLPWKVRALLRTQGLLTKVGALPDPHKVLTKPMAVRMALGAPKGLIGDVPEVPFEDRQVATRDGASIRVRVYRPASASDQPVLYTHGGGFVLGGIDSCDHICKRLAHEANAVVVSVEYRLAPDHKFPVPVQDCVDAAHWLLGAADELGVDPAKLVVAGDSGGGNFAAVLAVMFRDEGRPLAGQLLIYPGVDLSMSLPGVNAYQGVGLTTADLQLCVSSYLAAGQDPTDPYASPWYADATGLAPAFVLTVDHDPLHGEGVAYAEKLLRAGVRVRHVNRPDHVHGSLSIPKLYRGVDEVYAEMVAFLRSVAVSQPA